jgi:signal transduction histidine kinase
LGTGLKRRFFLTIAIVLAVTISGVGFLQYFLFRAEQFRLIDQQIESVASLLISSDLSRVELKEFEDAAKIIEDITEGERPNQFVIVYNRKGVQVYRSSSADYLPGNISLTPTWQTIENGGHFIRVLSVPLEKHKVGPVRMLQTGLILDEALVRWREVGRYVFMYSSLLLILILFSTFILSRTLLLPLTDLANYLRYMGSRFDETQISGVDHSAQVPPRALRLTKSKDEFGQLVQAAQGLHDRIGQALRTTQVWTAQMAHEMKTPLTILQNRLDALSQSDDTPVIPSVREQTLKEAQKEVLHLNRLINSFLEWTAVENFPVSDSDLHAIRLKSEVEEIAEKMARDYPGRITLEADSMDRVFARPGFVQQAVSNLISNALKYSPAESVVRVVLKGSILSIYDRGSGVPAEVLGNIGQPFNYGRTQKHGFGLGLAWVTTICRKYGWQLEFLRTVSPGEVETESRLNFKSDS